MFCHHFILCFFCIKFFLLFRNLFCKIILLVKCVIHFDRTKNLKHIFQKVIMYFRTIEQQLFRRNLGCYLRYCQYQMRCYGCIFKFPQIKIRESAPCVTLIWCARYQDFTERRAYVMKENLNSFMFRL